VKSVEQECRDLLERVGVEGAQNFSAGELVELAQLVLWRKRCECLAGIEGGGQMGSGTSTKPHSEKPSDLNPSDTSTSVFTREDVAGLRERAANSRESYRHGQDIMSTRLMHDARRAYELFESIAGRIEALLPPEEK
jgi:hypothetical protein